MIAIPSELKEALKHSDAQLLRLRDPATDEEYVVMRVEKYEQMQHLLSTDHGLTQDEQRRLMHQAGMRAGWDDPEMDVYNDLVKGR